MVRHYSAVTARSKGLISYGEEDLDVACVVGAESKLDPGLKAPPRFIKV